MSERRPRLGVVLTGGTIATRDGAVLDVAHDVIDLRTALPEWVRAAVHDGWGESSLSLDVRQPVSLLSENIRPFHWLTIASAVRDLVDGGAHGVLVLHGTDTAAYTAAALSYLLSDLDTPVVLTGSNLPPDASGSDAAVNVRDAATALRELPRGVFMSFAGSPDAASTVHLGTQVRKVHAGGAAFESVNRPPVGRVTGGMFEPIAVPSMVARNRQSERLVPNVLRIACHPGLDFAVVADAAARSTRGVVIELYPCATGPVGDDPSGLERFVERLRSLGIVVIGVVSRTGPDPLATYATSAALHDAGLRFVPGLTPEAAAVKLMWCLGQTDAVDEVESLMAEPIAGDVADVLVVSSPMEDR